MRRRDALKTLLALLVPAPTMAQDATVSTLIGTGAAGYSGNGQRGYSGDGGAATAASLNMPHEIQFDSAGHLYIAERDNHVIRKVDSTTGAISTFAGTGSALDRPHGVLVDSRGVLYVGDSEAHRIRTLS